jgi:hypothetical protein
MQDEGEMSPTAEQEWVQALLKLKNKDPSIYDKGTRLFQESSTPEDSDSDGEAPHEQGDDIGAGEAGQKQTVKKPKKKLLREILYEQVQRCVMVCLLSLLHAYCPFHLSVLSILILRILMRSSGADSQEVSEDAGSLESSLDSEDPECPEKETSEDSFLSTCWPPSPLTVSSLFPALALSHRCGQLAVACSEERECLQAVAGEDAAEDPEATETDFERKKRLRTDTNTTNATLVYDKEQQALRDALIAGTDSSDEGEGDGNEDHGGLRVRTRAVKVASKLFVGYLVGLRLVCADSMHSACLHISTARAVDFRVC